MATSQKNNSSRKSATKSRTRRAEPGSRGQGSYYHVEVRPNQDFVTYRTQDVGDPGHLQRVAGKRESGSWTTVKWLIDKNDAHVEGDSLVGDTAEAKDLIKKLRSKPVHKKGDVFEATPRRNVPERSKPTAAQTRARRQNIKKAQAAKTKS